MGTWGTDLYSDDTACDVRDVYKEILGDGISEPESVRFTFPGLLLAAIVLALSISACNSPGKHTRSSASPSPTTSAIPVIASTTSPGPTFTATRASTNAPSPSSPTYAPTSASTEIPASQMNKPSTPLALLTTTKTPVPSATITPIISIQQICVTTVEDHLPEGINVSGSLLLFNWIMQKWSTFDLQSREKRSSPFPTSISPFDYYPFFISDAKLAEYAISPDAKWMAYIEREIDDAGLRTIARKLKLMSVDGRKQDLAYWPVDWQWIIGWIDNQQIALSIPGYPDGTVVILNPFTGQWQVMPPDIPDLALSSWLYPDWAFPSAFEFYNPFLTQVVYASGDEGENFAVLDLGAQKQLWNGSLYSYPKWSPDGAYLAAITDAYGNPGVQGLVGVDVNARARQVTLPIDSLYPHTIDHFTWSPDSRYIAVTNNLALVDVVNRHVIDFCIESENKNTILPPVWSPDSRFIAISILKDNTWETIIIDISAHTAYKLADKGDIAYGWMTLP
jgi:hypothetical protein